MHKGININAANPVSLRTTNYSTKLSSRNIIGDNTFDCIDNLSFSGILIASFDICYNFSVCSLITLFPG